VCVRVRPCESLLRLASFVRPTGYALVAAREEIETRSFIGNPRPKARKAKDGMHGARGRLENEENVTAVIGGTAAARGVYREGGGWRARERCRDFYEVTAKVRHGEAVTLCGVSEEKGRAHICFTATVNASLLSRHLVEEVGAGGSWWEQEEQGNGECTFRHK
jgi:hypothetical protein